MSKPIPAGCERVRGLTLLPDQEALRLASVSKALSDPVRVQIVHLLEQHPDLCNCEFEEILELTQSKISYHLKVLLDANLITRRPSGTWSHYSLIKTELLARLRALDTTPRP
ncbi:MAG TPA: metalloregulator ArsR/SmtB family transcription factor [Symbiobacteriaceae bacterium]|nr:metalloregulator ArsR/SmtB family transcription factor [Symbiobacteriaceae bacterium]